jgi:hypothetical protein
LEITIIKRSLADVNLEDKIASAPKHNSMTVQNVEVKIHTFAISAPNGVDWTL